ncbi:PREDICTED: uncharacterized protein LOC109236374 [Nicotiana attenuata]|uniref:uncharacterized protein LOC109236374 n=1 Tax=Nicotiana attenuata TaxID=49451 RepID=UPI0009059A6D|nr:PREDICTED: uncharacterized protein LOC109236374 [Nicotiana attenuata]
MALKLDNNGKFQCFFVAYEALIQGFLFMRKVIAVDGIFLTGKHRGVLLSAVAQDSENHIFPVAFCVVDKECNAAYEKNFEQLSSIHPDNVELCIISNRHISIANGISKFYPQDHHGFCLRHLAENIRKKFHCGDLLHHYYSATKAYRIDEFNDHFQQIKDNDTRVAKYLEEDVGFHQWSRAHFPSNRYEVLTTNNVESVNSMFLLEREFPITALFDAINRRFAQKFHERHIRFLDTPTICVPSVKKKINKNATLGNRLLVHPIRQQVFSINGHGAVAKVDLRNRACSCREFDLDKIPCPHAIAALRVEFGAQYGTSIYDYTSDFYYIDTCVNAYVIEIHPVPSEECWEVPPELVERKIPPSSCEIQLGRRKTKRIPVSGEVKKKQNICSICKRTGHKRTTCKKRTEGTSNSIVA